MHRVVARKRGILRGQAPAEVLLVEEEKMVAAQTGQQGKAHQLARLELGESWGQRLQGWCPGIPENWVPLQDRALCLSMLFLAGVFFQ